MKRKKKLSFHLRILRRHLVPTFYSNVSIRKIAISPIRSLILRNAAKHSRSLLRRKRLSMLLNHKSLRNNTRLILSGYGLKLLRMANSPKTNLSVL